MSFFNTNKTVHTARTLMFNELSTIMDYSIDHGGYLEALEQNISGKRTMKNLSRTNAALKNLYSFDNSFLPFVLFKRYWPLATDTDKRYMALIYAVGMDFLLRDSVKVVLETFPGEILESAKLAKMIDQNYGEKYSANTRISASQNLISSWKQAGYLSTGKKNIRLKTEPGIIAATFAFLMSYLNAERGDFIFSSLWVKTLDQTEQQLKNLAVEASKRDLLEYKYSGSVNIITFDKLMGELGQYGLQS